MIEAEVGVVVVIVRIASKSIENYFYLAEGCQNIFLQKRLNLISKRHFDGFCGYKIFM